MVLMEELCACFFEGEKSVGGAHGEDVLLVEEDVSDFVGVF